jgi:hypothetical protein
MDTIHSVFQFVVLENRMFSITLKNRLLVRSVKAAELAGSFEDIFRQMAVLK